MWKRTAELLPPRVFSKPSAALEAVHKAIEEKGIAMETAEITSLPELTAPLSTEKEMDKITRLVDLLEDNDDVQAVYTNAELAG